MTVTVVSCYYRVASKFPSTQYDAWIQNFMSLPMHTIIYSTGEALADLLQKYPPSPSRMYVDKPISAFNMSKYDWSRDHSEDSETSVGHSIDLYKIWGEKAYFVCDAIERNPYNSEKYVWCDIGCFRNAAALPRFQTFPNSAAIPADKISMIQMEGFRPGDKPYPISNQFKSRITVGGTMFGGGIKVLKWFKDAYTQILEEADASKVFKGKDQNLHAFLLLRYPSKFHILRPILDDHYDKWFHLHVHWSTAPRRHYAIVGPGIMSIPPTGWGACEILIWDYAQSLKTQGHQVTIVNTPDMAEALSQLLEAKPDVVHIQYDDHAYLAPLIAPHVKLVALTSHYGYLDQQERWGGYTNTFNTMTRIDAPNLYHFVLSPSIANIYAQHGVPLKTIRVTPNGADASSFTYNPSPSYPERSIVVGKIEPRKGQYRLQHNPTVWFAGNRYGQEFDYSNPRWLGEWSKPQLYKTLTEYANLVLLSDGEADPLVTKEALIAGLGLVLSPWATANLDTTKPYITVIPHDKLSDREYIDAKIAENRRSAIAMRPAIREYGLTFSWDKKVKEYATLVESLL
jgi:hypothetical protein